MTREELLQQITDIGTCEDLVEVRTKLTDLTSEVTNIFDTNEKLSRDNEEHIRKIEDLRSDNMKLFLKVQDQNKKPEDIIDEPKPEKITKSFEELYNEK